jgi:hypothetical protein
MIGRRKNTRFVWENVKGIEDRKKLSFWWEFFVIVDMVWVANWREYENPEANNPESIPTNTELK